MTVSLPFLTFWKHRWRAGVLLIGGSDSGTISKGPFDAYPEEKKIFQEGFIR